MFNTFIFTIYNLIFPSNSLILPNLWLGDMNTALDPGFFISNNINIIVNCTPNIPFITGKNISSLKLEKFRIPVEDSLLEKDFVLLQQWFELLLPILLQNYKNGKKIFIHCYVGKQRSAALTAALIKTLIDDNCPLEEIKNLKNENFDKEFNNIIKFILSKRYHAFTFGFRINFKKSYYRYFEKKQ
jgi:hypothetical protein